MSSPPSSGAPASASPSGFAAPSRERAACQFPGCLTRAKYGPKDGPPTACQAHKRTGQYTINRHGEMLIATRDGDAFRAPAAAAPVSPAARSGPTETPARSRGSSLGGSEKSASSSGKKATTTTASKATTTSASMATTTSASKEASMPARKVAKKSTPKVAKTSTSKVAKTSASKVAKTSTSPTKGAKRANKPGLASGAADGSPPSRSQVRPCLFPGCNSLPEYGLPGAARAVYCFSHKKGSMVRIFAGASDLQSNGIDPKSPATVVTSNEGIDEMSLSKSPSAAAATPASKKKARALTTNDESEAKKARHGAKSTGEDGAASNNGGNQVDEMSIEKGSEESLTAEPGLKATAGTTAPSPRKSVSAGPPASRMGDVEGMAPSAEILLVRRAREAAKREAEAGGGGRRPRAPSRRALEASGRMTGTGAQWMTREKKAEEARMNAELREERKQYRAAGLKVGVVLEAFVPEAAAAGAVGSGSVSGVGVGVGGGSAETAKEAVMPIVDPGWHKVPPAVLSAPPLQPQTADNLEVSSAAAVETGEKQDTPTAAANSA
ncbi:unnamed protein product [Scytosiphon promiscuus]